MGGVEVRDGELGAEVYAVINLLMQTAPDRSPIGAQVGFGAGPLAARALPEAGWLGDLPPCGMETSPLNGRQTALC
jgi:hypothetical protein